jgi:NAD(P)-dependent dehydrogenase (short-subunit alcohol dehydrogenase family)
LPEKAEFIGEVPMVNLIGKIAVVTGGSRGVGKGIALGLGEAGATVYITGRTTQEGSDIEKLGGTVFSTAEEVTAAGGKGIAIACDHRDDSQVETVFQRVLEDNGRLDILVNNA